MQNLIISRAIEGKLRLKHGLTRGDVEQCFRNRTGSFVLDTRLEHQTEPPTEWFISENDRGTLIKVVCIFDRGSIYLKSAFLPNSQEISIYNIISQSC